MSGAQVLLFSATFSSSVRENALEFAPDAVVNTKKYAELRLGACGVPGRPHGPLLRALTRPMLPA